MNDDDWYAYRSFRLALRPVTMSPGLCEFLRVPSYTRLNRVSIVMRIHNYIKSQHLLCSSDEFYFVVDKALSTICKKSAGTIIALDGILYAVSHNILDNYVEDDHPREKLKTVFDELHKHFHRKLMHNTVFELEYMPPNNVLKSGGIQYQKLTSDLEFQKRWK